MKATELGEGTALILALAAIGDDEEAIETIKALDPETDSPE